MEKVIFSLIVGIFLLGAASTSAASLDDSGEKLKRGLKNFITAPLEIPKKLAYYSAETNYHPYGIAAGAGEGGVAAVQKFLAGIIQILTFPFEDSHISYDLY